MCCLYFVIFIYCVISESLKIFKTQKQSQQEMNKRYAFKVFTGTCCHLGL